MPEEQKDITKTPDNKPVVSHQKSVRKFLREAKMANWDPHNLIESFVEEIKKDRPGKNKKVDGKIIEAWNKVLPIVSLDNHYELASTVGEHIRPLVIEFANNIVIEYGCQTSSEKALAEVVVSAYARVLECSKAMQDITLVKYTSNALNGLYAVISTELDRANRHFITALATLRQIKSPTMEVNVRAHTAIIAQNQQINAGQPTEPLKADYGIN